MMKRNTQTTVSLAILVKNEFQSSEVIFPLIPKGIVDTVFVIDGGSVDGTVEYYKKNNVQVYGQSVSGLGGAVFEARKRCKDDSFILFHPDGNEDPLDIEIIASYLRRGREFVIPSRMIKGAWNEEDTEYLRPRKWFNKSMALLSNLLWNESNPFVSEIVQGFRGIRCDVFDNLNLDRTDCTVDFQMVIRALKQNIPILEFPTKEGNRLFGETHFKSLETGAKELDMFAQEIFNEETYFVEANAAQLVEAS